MGCACGKNGSALYNFLVTNNTTGETRVVSSKQEARVVISSWGGRGAMRAVLAANNPVTK